MIFMARIWHKDLVSVLPFNVLIDQCRLLPDLAVSYLDERYLCGTVEEECLKQKLKEYSFSHLYTYSLLVYKELEKREANDTLKMIDCPSCSPNTFLQVVSEYIPSSLDLINFKQLFNPMMSTRYLLQDLIILERMYDFGEISFEEWFKILSKTRSMHAYCEETYQSLFV